MSQPMDGTVIDGEVITPGSPRWYLTRLTQRLLSRQTRYDRLERYMLGNHDYPNGDKRYVVALRELQRKCRTNYCVLIAQAVTNRMKVNGFQFGPESQEDEDAKKIWTANNMDLQSSIIINTASVFGDAYVLVAPPLEEDEDGDGLPIITAEDPRLCITESDPRHPTRLLAGLKMWQDDASQTIWAVLYLPESILLYQGPTITDYVGTDIASLTQILVGRSAAAGGFKLVDEQPNPVGEVTLIRVNWQPAFGSLGRGEFEGVIDIQDRINTVMLERMVLSKSQAFNQRWMTGAKKGEEFKAGADMVWATVNQEAKFGQFDAVDFTQINAAINDDVGHLAAVTGTPATYLMNRMVNVSGDTLTQDQSALVTKIRLRQEAVGWAYERVMRLAFKIDGDTAKAKETEVVTLWRDAEVKDLAGLGDLFSKLTAGGVALDIAMKVTGLFTNDQIASAKEQFEEQQKMAQEMALEQGQQAEDGDMGVAKQQGQNAVAAVKAKPKPTSKPKPKS